MTTRRTKKRIFAVLLALALMASTLFVEDLVSTATEKYETSWDGADIGSSDGTDVSGNEPAVTQEDPFLVIDSTGEIFGKYDIWDELLADFKARGDVEEEYVISVLPEAVVGKTMPSKSKEITLTAADAEQSTIYFSNTACNMATPLVVDAKAVCVADSAKAVNINTKGKKLTLNGTQKLGNVKGTSAGSLQMNGDVQIQGNLQTFKYVTVDGTLQVDGKVSAVTNLIFENGIVYLKAGKGFAVTNVDATAGGVLGFPGKGTPPTVKISGKVSGRLALKQFEETQAGYVEQKFVAGSKLLTAGKATADQFILSGERQVCYKKGSVVYVGAEVLELYSGEEHVATYAQWSDVTAKVNALKNKSAIYRVLLLDDYVVNGALTMPKKANYSGLILECHKGEEVSLQATGALTMTADMTLGTDVKLGTKQISGGTYKISLGERTSLETTGNLTVKGLSMDQGASVQTGGKLTVKATLETTGSNELRLTHKKGASVKDTISRDRIVIKVLDKTGNLVTLTQNTIVMNITGNSYATQYQLLNGEEQQLPLYRKGNTLRVQGNLETPISLYYAEGTEEICLGEYVSLADVKNEIARRKIKAGVYRVHAGEEILAKGALPLPKSGTYKSIAFTGERIRVTSNITLTGETQIYNTIQRIKSQNDVTPVVVNVNLAKNTLKIMDGGTIDNLGNVTGSNESCLQIAQTVQQSMSGNLMVANLRLDGVLQVEGDITVTDVYPQSGNRLDYDLTETFTVKGRIRGGNEPLVLNPYRYGKVPDYIEGMKVVGSAANASVIDLAMAGETDLVLYKDGNAICLGAPLLTVYENTLDYESVQNAESLNQVRFARINDALDYVNRSGHVNFVVRLDENIPSAGRFTELVTGKKLVLCGFGGENKVLNLTGSITLNGSSLDVYNIELNNKTAAGVGVILKNGATLWLRDTAINTLSASEGTSVTFENQVGIHGAVTGAGSMTMMENAVVRAAANMSVGTLTLNAATDGNAQLRMQTGKTITISGRINTPEGGRFILNQVDKNDVLASLSEGAILATAPFGTSSQFKTQNIMPGTFLEWSLIKKSNNIVTSEASEGDGEWSGDYL